MRTEGPRWITMPAPGRAGDCMMPAGSLAKRTLTALVGIPELWHPAEQVFDFGAIVGKRLGMQGGLQFVACGGAVAELEQGESQVVVKRGIASDGEGFAK